MNEIHAKPRRRRRWLIVTVVLALLAAVAWWRWPREDPVIRVDRRLTDAERVSLPPQVRGLYDDMLTGDVRRYVRNDWVPLERHSGETQLIGRNRRLLFTIGGGRPDEGKDVIYVLFRESTGALVECGLQRI